MAPKSDPSFLLEVVGGDDDKAVLSVGKAIVTIGRARDADLPLRDPTVSRHHVQVLATKSGVQLVLCGNATRFLIDGRPFKKGEARPGQRVTIGTTALRVREVAAPTGTGDLERTDVAALMTGAVGDARGLADVHALVEALDGAATEDAVIAALQRWVAEHGAAGAAVVERESATGGVDVVERAAEGEGDQLVLSVPAVCRRPARLAFTLRARELTSTRKRVLVVAGRLVGSALERTRRLEAVTGESEALRTLHFGSARAFLGTSEAARRLASVVPRLAASDASVLIDGETGVGKTFLARLIHEGGPRASEPLRVLNCAAIPEALLESELFGHERGAFTGATASRAGALESAGAGTLFLDEIGELSLGSQAKLLRALEEKKFERVGSNETRELRARVVCATNRDLARAAGEGGGRAFRSDLLYRISVVRMTIPPLRERGEDLVLLARHLLGDLAAAAHRRVDGFSEAALEAIRRYSWPGNVRELRNAIEHAIVLGDQELIQEEDFPAGIQARPEVPADRGAVALLVEAVDSAERAAVTSALLAAGGNRTRAAAILGVSRMTLYKKLRQL